MKEDGPGPAGVEGCERRPRAPEYHLCRLWLGLRTSVYNSYTKLFTSQQTLVYRFSVNMNIC